jgi:hypothetical protein
MGSSFLIGRLVGGLQQSRSLTAAVLRFLCHSPAPHSPEGGIMGMKKPGVNHSLDLPCAECLGCPSERGQARIGNIRDGDGLCGLLASGFIPEISARVAASSRKP